MDQYKDNAPAPAWCLEQWQHRLWCDQNRADCKKQYRQLHDNLMLYGPGDEDGMSQNPAPPASKNGDVTGDTTDGNKPRGNPKFPAVQGRPDTNFGKPNKRPNGGKPKDKDKDKPKGGGKDGPNRPKNPRPDKGGQGKPPNHPVKGSKPRLPLNALPHSKVQHPPIKPTEKPGIPRPPMKPTSAPPIKPKPPPPATSAPPPKATGIVGGKLTGPGFHFFGGQYPDLGEGTVYMDDQMKKRSVDEAGVLEDVDEHDLMDPTLQKVVLGGDWEDGEEFAGELFSDEHAALSRRAVEKKKGSVILPACLKEKPRTRTCIGKPTQPRRQPTR